MQRQVELGKSAGMSGALPYPNLFDIRKDGE